MTKDQYQKELNNIVKSLKTYKPEKIILFGSAARGEFKKDSDIDIVILKKTKKNRIDRAKEVYNLVESNLPVDIIIYTPEEFQKRKELGDFFVEDILTQGKILYEK
jgi:predicted nucleotidyltransferase